ncbi:MAG TPA: isochorismatase family protein [Burkholderiaceae bacterium]|nr:isochorismatase family protein [Burkholderiaceae bacterium]
MQTALLVIDVQESFRHRTYWSGADVPAFLSHLNALVDGCTARGVPIVRVFHSDGPEAVDNPFSHASGQVRPLEGLARFEAALTCVKSRHSALVGTPLAQWLVSQGIRRVIIAGIRTEQCCETTTRHASDEGWDVDFVGDATLTFDMQTPAGAPLTAAQIRERTETVLKGRFATLATVEEALARVPS